MVMQKRVVRGYVMVFLWGRGWVGGGLIDFVKEGGGEGKGAGGCDRYPYYSILVRAYKKRRQDPVELVRTHSFRECL